MMPTDARLGWLRAFHLLALSSLLFVYAIGHVHAENVDAKPVSDATDKNGPAFTIRVSPGGWG